MPRALKVFRTPIGFHDAYVAVPTKKAALEAWGSSANLFARGAAEEVTDPKLMKAALARPGEVVKVARATAAEHMAALGKMRAPRAKRIGAADPTPDVARREASPKPNPKPKPKRDKLDAAEAALSRVEDEQRAAADDLARREQALAEERRALEKAQAVERAKREQAREVAERAYAAALAVWRG